MLNYQRVTSVKGDGISKIHRRIEEFPIFSHSKLPGNQVKNNSQNQVTPKDRASRSDNHPLEPFAIKHPPSIVDGQNPAPVGRWFIQVYPIIIQLFTVVHGYQLQIQLVPYARARLQDDGMPLVLGPHTSASSVSLI